MMDIYRIKISPEVLNGDIINETYSGYSFGVYTGLTNILSGGINGTSLLTGLTVPILLKQKYQDIGYYSGFDGNISQEVISTNFIFYGNVNDEYTYSFINTSDTENVYLFDSTYVVKWGDGSQEIVTSSYPISLTHTYPNPVSEPVYYTITLTQVNTWGTVNVEKIVKIPYSISVDDNPFGTVTFANNDGTWSGTPSSYNFTATGDAYNNLAQQVSSFYTTVPFIVSGSTLSRLSDLITYGSIQFTVGQSILLADGTYGTIDSLTEAYTGYTINDVTYYDFSNGTSVFVLPSSGMTPEMFSVSAITKNEVLLNIIDQPQLFNSVFVERGKNSGVENFQRIGEVSNMYDLLNYGYNFFNIV